LALSLARALEEALESRRGGALLAGAGQRATHLTGDLSLAGDDGLQTGCHREQVLGDPAVLDHAVGAVQVCGGDAGGLRDGLQDGTRVEVLGLDIGFEAVAGREHDGSLRTGFDKCRGDGLGVAAEAFEQFEGSGLMTRRDAEQHPTRIRRVAMSGIRGEPYPRVVATARQRHPRRPVPGIRIAGSDRIGSMTDLLRALAGQKPERTPVWFMRQAGRSLPEYREL